MRRKLLTPGWGMGMAMMSWMGTALAQPAECGDLGLEGLWVNPWNASQARLLVSNPTWGIWGYPSWKLADANGAVLGQEPTVYFGIGETSIHDIPLAAPWLDAADVPVVIKAKTLRFEGDYGVIEASAAGIFHNGKNIGATHSHGGVTRGGSDTDPPNG